MGNIIVETECDAPESGGGSGILTSQVTYDGANLAAINFTTGLNLNTALSNLNDVIQDKCDDVDANTAQISINVTNIATNTTNIAANAAAIAALITDDIGFVHPGIPAIGDDSIVDLSAESTLNGVLEAIIDEIGTLQGLDTTLFSRYQDVQYYVNEFVISGFGITGSSTTPDVDLAAGVAMNDGKELVVSGQTVLLTANRDNYIDLQFDGTYDVKTVAIAAPAPALPTDENRFYRLRVDGGGNITDTLDLRVNEPFVGTQIVDDTMPNAKLTDSGVTAATYELANLVINSKGIVTSATNISGTDNRLLRYDSGYATDSFIWDTGTATGFGTMTPQEAISLGNSDSLIVEAGIPTGIGSALIAGGLPVNSYFFVLAALTSAGEGLISSETTQTTTGTDDIRITWTRLAGAIGYRLYIGTATGVYTDYIDIASGETISFDYDGTGTSAGSPPGAPNTAYSVQINNGTSWFGQGVVIGDDSIASSAILELESNTRGILIPRMTTTARDAIGTPATGLEIYNTSTNRFNYYNGTAWVDSGDSLDIGDLIGSSTIGSVLFVGASNDLQEDNANLFWNDTINALGIGTNTPGATLSEYLTIETASEEYGWTHIGPSGEVLSSYIGIFDTNQSVQIGAESTDDFVLYGFNAGSYGAFIYYLEDPTNLFWGVNTAAPTAAWDVNGALRVRGNAAFGNSIVTATTGIRYSSTTATTGQLIALAGAGTTRTGELISLVTTASISNVGLLISVSGAPDNYALVTTGGRSGFGTASPDASALVEMSSTSQGFLMPRMTTAEKNAITLPAEALLLYDTTTDSIDVQTAGGEWDRIWNQERIEIYTTSSFTVPLTLNTPQPVNPTTTFTPNIEGFSENVNGEATYDGSSVSKQVYVQYHVCGTVASGSGQQLRFSIYLNGSERDGTVQVANFDSSVKQTISGGGIIGLDNGDIVDLSIENDTDSVDFDMDFFNLSIFSVE